MRKKESSRAAAIDYFRNQAYTGHTVTQKNVSISSESFTSSILMWLMAKVHRTGLLLAASQKREYDNKDHQWWQSTGKQIKEIIKAAKQQEKE